MRMHNCHANHNGWQCNFLCHAKIDLKPWFCRIDQACSGSNDLFSSRFGNEIEELESKNSSIYAMDFYLGCFLGVVGLIRFSAWIYFLTKDSRFFKPKLSQNLPACAFNFS